MLWTWFNTGLVELSPSLGGETGGDVSPTPPKSLGASRCLRRPPPAFFLLDCCPVWFPFLGIVFTPLLDFSGLQKLFDLELFTSAPPRVVLPGTYLCCGANTVFFLGRTPLFLDSPLSLLSVCCRLWLGTAGPEDQAGGGGDVIGGRDWFGLGLVLIFKKSLSI